MSLKGTLPQNLNQLTKLQRLGLQRNQFTGALPSLSGLSELQSVYLDFNQFDSIPSDCFDGLASLQFLALDANNFNASTGWSFPEGLQDSAQLTNLSCMSCNLAGPLPYFLGALSSLQNLRLSGNNLSGEIPASFKRSTSLRNLWLNNQNGGGLSGTLDVVTTMDSVNVLWLHGNQFTGTIPESIGNLTVLQDLNLNGNKLVGFVPDSLAKMPLEHLDLNNNQLMGPVPNFKATEVSYAFKCILSIHSRCPLCTRSYGASRVSRFAELSLNISFFMDRNLSGTLSPSVAKLGSLIQIKLGSNNLSGQVPENWTSLTSLKTLDLGTNNISPPLPKFADTVNVVTVGNPLLTGGSPSNPNPSPGSGRSGSPPSNPSSPTKGTGSSPGDSSEPVKPKRSTLVAIIAPAPSSLVIHPRDPSDSDNTVKIVVANNTNGSASTITGSGSASRNSSGVGESHVIEAGNLVISVQVLRNVTKNFASENELGRGGFGVVYKGELDDGTKIAVKRMESGVISSKAIDEFQAEIAVLSKVRHRHLVSLLGYSVEGYERILVYEYMPQGALSKHLFHWKSSKLEPLSWKRRLNIALDVARGMEYLHNLAHRSFIHRDLKSSNILLGDDFRAKVSDFGLVKLAPDGEKSMVTRLAGTFGYLAPEYADQRKSQYLAAWFWRIKSDKQKLRAAIDPALDVKDETFESISIIAELAGHCTAREPNQRPDMGHAVNVLAPLVEKWKPLDDDTEDYCGIDYSLPLNHTVKAGMKRKEKDLSYVGT
ncbi:receptor protein kinase TMK1-like [Populus alba x Populus x berolinensis]|nr:receptor protein kinase TMK1-like [Populus alba x Populus x berolinensis]